MRATEFATSARNELDDDLVKNVTRSFTNISRYLFLSSAGKKVKQIQAKGPKEKEIPMSKERQEMLPISSPHTHTSRVGEPGLLSRRTGRHYADLESS